MPNPPHVYATAKALLEERLADGQYHRVKDLAEAAHQRGLPGAALWVPASRLVVHCATIDGFVCWRLPTVCKPAEVNELAWATAWLRTRLSPGQPARYRDLVRESQEAQVLDCRLKQAAIMLQVHVYDTKTSQEDDEADGLVSRYWYLPLVE